MNRNLSDSVIYKDENNGHKTKKKQSKYMKIKEANPNKKGHFSAGAPPSLSSDSNNYY